MIRNIYIKNCSGYNVALASRYCHHDSKDLKASKKKPSLKKLFSSAWEFSSQHELMAHLSANVVHFEQKGLVVINKPYGLPLKPSPDSTLCLEHCLKDLAMVLRVKELKVIKSASRFMSGCTLLSTMDSISNAHQNSRNRIKNKKILHENYLAVTLAHPKRDGITENVDVHMTKIPEKVNHNDNPVIEPFLSRDLMSRSKLKQVDKNVSFRVSIHSRILSRSGHGNASLVSLQPTHNRRNFMQAYMADQLSPILGDQFFSYRVKHLAGRPTSVSHHHTPGVPTPQSIPSSMLDLLGLRPGDEVDVPVHLHLFRVHLPSFNGSNKDLTVYAPPPTWFMATLKTLKLNFDFEFQKEKDKIENWQAVAPRIRRHKNSVQIEIIKPDDENSVDVDFRKRPLLSK